MKVKNFLRMECLIEAALNEFTTKDYDKASLNTIIRNAGISKGVFYYHFENKEDLYLYLLKTGTEAKWQYICEQTDTYDSGYKELDIFDKFIYQAKLGIGFASQYPKYHALSLMLLKERNNPIYRTAINYLGDESTDGLTQMIKEAIAKHEFKEEFDETFIIKILKHLFLEFNQIFQEEIPDHVFSDLKKYVNFIKYGLKT